MRGLPAVRWLVVLLSALCLPLCCCNFRAFLQACPGCDDTPPAAHAPAPSGCHRSGSCHKHADQAHRSDSDHQRSAPTHPDCRCGKEPTLVSLPGKQPAAPPPVLLGHLSLPALARARPAPPAPVRAAHSPPLRAQTLLRQHCALIV
jgi:hypothetical protein